jgi:hypothetical protein
MSPKVRPEGESRSAQREGISMNSNVTGWIAAAIVATVTAVATASVHAQDRANIDRTQIIGNRELPKVLVIVPWKKPLPGDLSGRPVDSLLDDALAPIDRDVFRRQVQYDAMTRAAASVSATAPATAAEPVAAPLAKPR